MVKVREDYPCLDDGQVDLETWLNRIRQKVELFDDTLLRACQYIERLDQEVRRDDVWSSRTSSYLTGLAMADILADLHLDQESLVAAVLYRSVREEKVSLLEIQKMFGPDIAELIEGTLRMAVISQIMSPDIHGDALGSSPQQQLDNLRRMLVSMIDDVRVALIKLAERTFAIREVKDATEERRMRVAREVFDIYAPLAHRLGIGHIKWELEDLSFRYLEPQAYREIAALLDEKRLGRQEYIQNVIDLLKKELQRFAIQGEVTGRAKHIYSIWRKMKRKGIRFSEVYDVRAVRLLVPEVRDCYAALGIVHSLWRHIPREFDDYIASPKENGYRSLHTAVIGPQGKALEVQIRTFAMHEEAELGVCAHWHYKEGTQGGKDRSYEGKIAWLRQVLEWQEDVGESRAEDLASYFNQAIQDDRVYVFTRDGHVVDLQAGSTPLDFAYHVHTEVGHSCRGARVNGRMVPLTYTLSTGDQIEIITSKGGKPSRDWLNLSLGYLASSRAIAKVRHWFKAQDRDQNLDAGREILHRELERLGMARVDLETVAPRFNYKSGDDVLVAIGAGDIGLQQIVHTISEQLPITTPPLAEIPVKTPRARPDSHGVEIEGVDNLMTTLARCCSPVRGEAILGYISHGRGVVIHTSVCPELNRLREQDPDRIMAVSWSAEPDHQPYPVDVQVRAYDRTGLLRDITVVLANEHVNVTGVQTHTDKSSGLAFMRLVIEVGDLNTLGRVLGRIAQLPHVIEVRRVGQGETH